MTLSDSAQDLMWVRAKVGDDPDDATLDDIFDTEGIGSRELCALWVLENRLANFLSSPATFNIEGVYSESSSANLSKDGLIAAIGALKAEIGVSFGDEIGDVVVFAAPRRPCR